MSERNRLEDAFWDWPGDAPRWFLEKWKEKHGTTLMSSSVELMVEEEVAWRMLWRARRLRHESGLDGLLDDEGKARAGDYGGELTT
jgi:hypothetical protein